MLVSFWLLLVCLISPRQRPAPLFAHASLYDISAESRAWMEMDARKEGTIVTKSGLHYRILSTGSSYWELLLPVDWVRRRPHKKSFCLVRFPVPVLSCPFLSFLVLSCPHFPFLPFTGHIYRMERARKNLRNHSSRNWPEYNRYPHRASAERHSCWSPRGTSHDEGRG